MFLWPVHAAADFAPLATANVAATVNRNSFQCPQEIRGRQMRRYGVMGPWYMVPAPAKQFVALRVSYQKTPTLDDAF